VHLAGISHPQVNGVQVGDRVGVMVGVKVGVGVRVMVGVKVGVGVSEAVGVAVSVGMDDGVWVLDGRRVGAVLLASSALQAGKSTIATTKRPRIFAFIRIIVPKRIGNGYPDFSQVCVFFLR
jgi:hypothetical protein